MPPGAVQRLLALLALGLLRHVAGQSVCDGTGLLIQEGLWSVSDATLNSRAPPSVCQFDGFYGTNLVKNGDFTYTVDDTEANSPESMFGLTTSVTFPFKGIKDWNTGGGGTSTYAYWGGNTSTKAELGWNPVAKSTGASPSCLYLGNGWIAGYYSGVTNLSSIFDINGFGQSSDLVLYPDAFFGSFGTSATPVEVNQTVTGLKVDTRYRLSFFQGGEDVTLVPQHFTVTGIAGISITGYDTTYFTVSAQTASYRFLDFIAKSASTTISFKNWGHININGPPMTPNAFSGSLATEMGMDDVVLTDCTAAPVSCCSKAAKAWTRPSGGKVLLNKPFMYNAKLANSKHTRKTNKHTAATPYNDVSFAMTIPEGVTVQSYKSVPKLSTTPTVDSSTGILTWPLDAPLAPGKSVKLSVTLLATNCSTPAALALGGRFSFTDSTGPQTETPCLKKPLYAWAPGCPKISKPASGKRSSLKAKHSG